MRQLIEQYFEGKLSPEEKKHLFQKIDTDPDWKDEFITIQNLRGLTAWTPNQTINYTNQSKRHITHSYWKQIYRYAAAILVAFTFSWFTSKNYHTNNNETTSSIHDEIIYQEVSTPAGQRAFIRLQDSTTIWLNARTTVRYPVNFSDNERRIELEGEAFFDVKEYAESPFIVSTENYNIKVTGTAFNVYAYKGRNEFSTSLTEGTVQVFDNNESQILQLNPNERAELVNGYLVKSDFYNMDFLLWKDGIYAFDDLPFMEIIKKLELYYDVFIIVNNNSIKKFKFSGKFRQRDGVERVLYTLQKIHRFSFTKDDEKNVITIE